MSKRSKSEDTSVGIEYTAQIERRSVPTFGSNLWERFARWSYRVSGRMVALSRLCKKRVLIPAALYTFALADVFVKGAQWLWLKTVCAAHDVHVSLARLKANRITAASIMASVTVAVISTTFFGLGFSLSINGEEVGYIMNAEDLDLAVKHVETQVSAALGRPYGLQPSTKLTFGLVERDRVLDTVEVEKKLVDAVSEISEMYVLTVDGEVIGASYKKENLQKVLDGFHAVSDRGTVLETSFNREVKIEKTVAETSLLKSDTAMLGQLSANITENRYYTIRRGDTWQGIAKENGLSVEQLKEMNSGVSLRRGNQLLVSSAIPYLTVRHVVQETAVESVAYKTVTVKNDSLYVGTKRVQTKGVPGNARVTVKNTFENGKKVASEQLSYEVLKEPMDEVVQVGTKSLPSVRGISASGDGLATGNLIRPVSGAIVYSDYGYRKSGFHSGIDFATSAGTPVRAADGGTVSFAGWKGDFGYLVIINHGNGLSTYYAHNAKLAVRVGQKVSRGQRIASVGSTGRSTGPHCHFEVRVNGKNVNPWRYIS